ncbi:MAG: substrate-binding domain-containing protein [Kiritimatiellae bacterium]|nr:substrate-binding domain-containing protein [Kiritimatiellia bacterium]
MSIPGEAAILGVDNDAALCENASPTLSSIRLDHEGLGYSAAKSLDVLMSGKRVRTNEELPPLDVIVRNSTIYICPHPVCSSTEQCGSLKIKGRSKYASRTSPGSSTSQQVFSNCASANRETAPCATR